MLEPSERISTLLAWCADNDIVIDPRLQMKESSLDGSIAVFSVGDIIGQPASLVQIPKAAVLSGAHLSLALALFIEILKGPTSRWFGYLQSLPSRIVDTALFWAVADGVSHNTIPQTNLWGEVDGINSSTEGQDEFPRFRRLRDGREALMWLKGTEVLKQLRGSENDNTSLLDQIRDYYASTVVPLVSRLPFTAHQVNLSGFYRAYSLVSSRAFLVDAYHGLAMVPIGDAFNHSQGNHVHLESDFYVCSTCGSVCECVHDTDNESSGNRGDSDLALAAGTEKALIITRCLDDCYEMVSCAPIMCGSEVYNTYGDKLGNAQLLTQYGFLLDGNEHDCITFDLAEFDEIVGSSGERHGLVELWRQVYREWSDECQERLTRESKLIYSESGGTRPVPGRERGRGLDGGQGGIGDFRLNADGKVTAGLWMFCVVVALHKVNAATRQGKVGEVVKLIRAVMDLQVMLEKEVEIGMTEEDGGALLFQITLNQRCSSLRRRPARQESYDEQRSSSSSPTETMAMTIQTVVSLCKSKMAKLGRVGADLANLGAVADSLEEDMTRTRLAISQVMCEYSLLSACESGWTELGSTALLCGKTRGYLPLTHPDAVI